MPGNAQKIKPKKHLTLIVWTLYNKINLFFKWFLEKKQLAPKSNSK